MVGISYRQKPYRRVMMQTFGATVHSSPSPETNAGRAALEVDPESLGSLGLAISEAVERAATDPEAAYSLGSVLNHVLMHQTVIGLEAKEQLAAFGEKGPDVVIGCAGGGSNFAGISFPFLRDKIAGAEVEIIAVEPASCPTLTRGVYAYDYGDAVGMAPLVPMHTLGHDFMPPGIHAGGLRYHGMAPLVSHAQNQGLIRAEAYGQLDCFAAGIQFAKAEGILPAPEPTHAIMGVIEAARRAEASGKEQVILFNLCGHGHFDMQAYDDYLSGRLQDHAMPEDERDRALAAIADFPAAPAAV
jgi:tryptophan synthase beta chain